MRYNDDDDDTEDYSPRSRNGYTASLRQTLIAAADKFELEKQRSEAQLRAQIAAERKSLADERKSLQAERAKTAELEMKVKEESAKADGESKRVKGLQEELSQCKVQVVGTVLLLTSLRGKIEALSKTALAAATAAAAAQPPRSAATLASPAEAVALSAPAEDAAAQAMGEDDGEGGEGGEGAEGGDDAEGAEAKQLTRNQRKKLKDRVKDRAKSRAAKAAAASGEGSVAEAGKNGEAAEGGEAVGGEAVGGEGGEAAELATLSAPAALAVVTSGAAPSGESSDLVAECEALLAELGELRELPGMTEFVCACREGKTRSIERVLSPTSVTELVETRAQQALCDGLEASVAGGHIKIAKLLIDGGADVHRTSALHIAIRHGQIALMQHLVATVAVSVNGRDEEGASPLHIAAEFNQPKAATYLLRNSAFVDSTDGKGRTPMEVAVAFKWKEMQRVLSDPSLLFWNRAARATKLYKASEYEPACECYARAQMDMDRMPTAPEPANVATFNFNWGRSSQALGRFSEGLRLFSKVLAAETSHQRALDHRAECHCKLDDQESALADLTELQTKFAITADEATLKGWVKRVAEIRAEQRKPSHEVLGIARDASEAEVRKAYRQLCLNWHPDKHASSTEDQRERARHRFCRIQAAYEKLQSAAKASSSPFSGFESASSGYARRTSA